MIRVRAPAWWGALVGGLARERIIGALAIAVVLVWCTGSYRVRNQTGIPAERFWDMKLKWHHCADWVLAGDSRVLMGLCPAAMAVGLPPPRTLNYAFVATAYTPEYLSRVAGVLDPESDHRAIILGITPHALTPHAITISEFEWRRTQSAWERFRADVLHNCRPIRILDVPTELIPPLQTEWHYRHYTRDGWGGMRRVPEDPDEALETYQAWFAMSQVDAGMVANLLAFVQEWSAAGTEVYGFRPPTNKAMVALEAAASGFDEAEFVAQFTAAGGNWIETDQYGYVCIDGSHLRLDAAVRFSQDMSAALRWRDFDVAHGGPATKRGHWE